MKDNWVGTLIFVAIIAWLVAINHGSHAEQPQEAQPPDAAVALVRLKALDAQCVGLLGTSPTDKQPGDAVRRLIAVEESNFVLIQHLWLNNAMTPTKVQQLWLDKGMPPNKDSNKIT